MPTAVILLSESHTFHIWLHVNFCCNCSASSDTYGQAASNVVTSNSVEQTIQHVMDIGGGSWDKETVTRALQAAYNNPERAIDYLYSVCFCLIFF